MLVTQKELLFLTTNAMSSNKQMKPLNRYHLFGEGGGYFIRDISPINRSKRLQSAEQFERSENCGAGGFEPLEKMEKTSFP